MLAETIIKTFFETAGRLGPKDCFLSKTEALWRHWSWDEVRDRVREISLGLISLGIQPGDRVAIFAATRVEWTLIDLAILSCGAITVPIYHSDTAEQALYILQHTESRLIFVEGENHRRKIESILVETPESIRIVQIEGTPPSGENTLSLEEVASRGSKGDRKEWERRYLSLSLEETATIVYTSGTTGPPKGVVLSHGNIMGEVEACRRLLPLGPDDIGLCFLPLAHILARAIQFLQLKAGFVHAYAESIEKLTQSMAEVSPHFMVSVPRVFEKAHERILAVAKSGSAFRFRLFSWALKVGPERSRIKHLLAQRLVLDKIRKRFGGRLRFSISGGAPLAKELGGFFKSIGILILNGYGLTETTAAVNCNSESNFRFDTVGKKLFGVEETIAPDGEILVRGPMVSRGYYRNPTATAESFTAEGWFRTGDIGRIDSDGHLLITDRKKEIIVTASGKKIAPQNIENMIKGDPLISQVMVHGDRRKYLSALITLNLPEAEKFARRHAIPFKNPCEIAHHPLVHGEIQKRIDLLNRKLASFESIKRFAILESDFTQEGGELTPTLKVKRKYVSEKYKEILDKLYQE